MKAAEEVTSKDAAYSKFQVFTSVVTVNSGGRDTSSRFLSGSCLVKVPGSDILEVIGIVFIICVCVCVHLIIFYILKPIQLNLFIYTKIRILLVQKRVFKIM